MFCISGGSAIEQECKSFIASNDRLNEGCVFVSTGGNLPAKHIIHVAAPVWKDGLQKESERLTEVVMKAMQQATLRQLASIALPAISSGAYG